MRRLHGRRLVYAYLMLVGTISAVASLIELAVR